MRWKKKEPKPKKKEPSVGEEMTLYSFAFLPKLIGDTWVWLERYKTIAMWSPNDPYQIGTNCSWHLKEYQVINRV